MYNIHIDNLMDLGLKIKLNRYEGYGPNKYRDVISLIWNIRGYHKLKDLPGLYSTVDKATTDEILVIEFGKLMYKIKYEKAVDKDDQSYLYTLAYINITDQNITLEDLNKLYIECGKPIFIPTTLVKHKVD